MRLSACTSFLFCLILLVIPAVAWAQDPGGLLSAPPCADYPFGRNVTVTGHSRAYEVAFFPLTAYGNAIADARLYDDPDLAGNKRIFATGAVTGIQNLAWPGSQATDSAPHNWILGVLVSMFDSYLPKDNFWSVVVHFPEFLRNPMVNLFAHNEFGVGDVLHLASKNNFQRQMAQCYSYGSPYQAADNIVLNIGGNDLLNYYLLKHTYQAEYLFVRYVLNPRAWLKLVFDRGAVDRELEIFWMWSMHLNNFRIALAVESIANYHLSDFHGPGWDHLGSYSKLLLVEEPPSLASWISQLLGKCCSDDPPWRIILYFADLDFLLSTYTYPSLVARHGPLRVAYLPMYFTFLGNLARYSVLQTDKTFYLADLTHFNDVGIKQYGRMVAAKMVDLAWLPRNPELNNVDLSPIYVAAPVDTSPIGNPGANTNPPPPGGCDLFCLIVLCYFFHICGG